MPRGWPELRSCAPGLSSGLGQIRRGPAVCGGSRPGRLIGCQGSNHTAHLHVSGDGSQADAPDLAPGKRFGFIPTALSLAGGGKPETPQLNMAVVTLAEMMEAGAHFGHQTRRWNPKMSRYIYCARNGVHIIDLVQTAVCMNNAYKWTRSAARSGKRFLFVGTKKQASEVIAIEATRCGAAYVNQRWLGGMLTNWTTMRARIDRLKDLERMESSGAIAMRPKKEAAVLRRELERLQKYLGGLKNMRRLPDVVVLVDQRRETNAVLEARKLDIPLVSMLDTNCDPDLCDVPIPCNDDAVRSVQLVLGRLADAINEGRHGAQDQRGGYDDEEG